MELTAIATTMPPGRYVARHVARWSLLVASCEATICHHRASARTISVRWMPWSSPSPSCETQHQTQLLASVYRINELRDRVITFLLLVHCKCLIVRNDRELFSSNCCHINELSRGSILMYEILTNN